MGLIDGMKERLGFGQQPEWQSDGAYDEYMPEDGIYDQDAGFQPMEQDDYSVQGGDVVSFDAYNPDTFKNVSFDSGHEPQVAPLGSSTSRSRSRSSRISARGASERHYGSPASDGATWATPEDPSFLDSRSTRSERDLLDQIGATRSSSSSDPYSQFDSEIRQIHRDPSARLEIVKPKVYSDVEKIATGCKAGKTVVIVLAGTKSDLVKRILDFSFGVASALNKNVDKAADKVLVISKGSEMLSSDERAFLVKKGILR